MNPEAVMALLATNLQAYLTAEASTAKVTRKAKDFAQRPKAEIAAGVVTLIGGALNDLDSARDLADVAGKMQIVLLYEFKLPENADGLTVEQAEWAFWDLIKEFLLAPGAGLCPLIAKRAQPSMQLDAPFGWLSVELEYAEID